MVNRAPLSPFAVLNYARLDAEETYIRDTPTLRHFTDDEDSRTWSFYDIAKFVLIGCETPIEAERLRDAIEGLPPAERIYVWERVRDYARAIAESDDCDYERADPDGVRLGYLFPEGLKE